MAFHAIAIPSVPITAPAGGIQTVAALTRHAQDPHPAHPFTTYSLRTVSLWIENLTSHAELACAVKIGLGFGTFPGTIVTWDELDPLAMRSLDPQGRHPSLALVRYNLVGNLGSSVGTPFYGVVRNRRACTIQWPRRTAPRRAPAFSDSPFWAIWIYPNYTPASTPLVAQIAGFLRWEEN